MSFYNLLLKIEHIIIAVIVVKSDYLPKYERKITYIKYLKMNII
jgi:hypothetical protein